MLYYVFHIYFSFFSPRLRYSFILPLAKKSNERDY